MWRAKLEKLGNNAVTDSRMGRDFDTYFQDFLIVEKSENSVELKADIFLKINLSASHLLWSSIERPEHSIFILGDGVD